MGEGVTAPILLFFVCLNSRSLSGHLPRAALLLMGVWESPERMLNYATGEKQDSKQNTQRAQPSVSLLLPFWLLPAGSARATGKAKGLQGLLWRGGLLRGSALLPARARSSTGTEQCSTCPTAALLRITRVPMTKGETSKLIPPAAAARALQPVGYPHGQRPACLPWGAQHI